MRCRFPVTGLLLASAWIAVWLATRDSAPESALPALRLDFPSRPFVDLFSASSRDEGSDSVPVLFTDVDGVPRPAKAALRGFSAWHHGTTKPSLRIKQKEGAVAAAPAEFVELSRPEDPLALCNWLPDQLAAGLGLLHEHSRHVNLQLDGRNAGIYLRSLRPGDDLAAASGRARGTFWKGDCLGERARLDLWSSTAAWRSAGADDRDAHRALDELLAALCEPADAAGHERLAAVFDVEVAARCAAIAVLTGSIHADRSHNHVWFFDPSRGRLEPLLWDANGFGIHAEPDLPVEVARHPLAERLLGDVLFVHRRNQILWQLLHGAGSATALLAEVDRHLARLGDALRKDPEPVRLVLRRGVFAPQRLDAHQLATARDEFATFVQWREAFLLAHFADARGSIAPHPDDPSCSVVTVSGTVAVRLERSDGGEVRSPDGHDASLLWPGLSERLFEAPQHRAMDGRGVAAPHARPAPLAYTIAAEPGILRLVNAFTGEPVAASARGTEADAGLRSVHPWQRHTEPPSDVHLGPGDVVLDEPLAVGAGRTLFLAAGTKLVLRPGARIVCRGSVVGLGTAASPISIRRQGCPGPALECIGSARVHLAHVALHDATAWSNEAAAAAPLLALRGCADARLEHCRLTHAADGGMAVIGGACRLTGTIVHGSHGIALLASDGGRVSGQRCEFAFGSIGVLARDGACVVMQGGQLRGNIVGARAERSARPFAGGSITLEAIVCTENGQFDVDADPLSTVELVSTTARCNPLASARVQARRAGPSGQPAAPR